MGPFVPPVQVPAPPAQPIIPHAQPVPPGPVLQLNWSHFKPEFTGKPDEDVEAHAFQEVSGSRDFI